jgi:hypothetical protein
MKKNKEKLNKVTKIIKITVKYLAICLRNKLLKPSKNKLMLKESLNTQKEAKKIQDVKNYISLFFNSLNLPLHMFTTMLSY